MTGEWWMVWPGNPALSVLILYFGALFFLYPARWPLHGVIRAVSRAISHPMRLGARWLMLAADELRRRNKVVLLAHGKEEIRQGIEREFERVTAVVQRDLRDYPVLQRKLMGEITRIEEDYQKSGEIPPTPPEWTKAVTAVAKIPPTGDGLVHKILGDIAQSMEKIQEKAISEYRKAYEERHRILKGFMPFWRSLNQTLTQVDHNLTGLQESSARIDSQMEKYEQINANSEKVEHSLTASASTQFIIASIVLAIAFGGAFVNYKLIALPMSAMVANDYITDTLRASDIAALVIIFVEASMGLFLMESLRITHLFPRINNLQDRMRRRFMWVAFSLLLTLAFVEVALAVLRDWIVVEGIKLTGELAGTGAAAAEGTGMVNKIPTAGQMVLGFILPFALAFVAIPLEYFIYSARTVFGVALVIAIRSAAFVLRFLGNFARQMGNLLVNLYDVLIFLPLLIERLVRSMRSDEETTGSKRSGGITSFPAKERVSA
ncbi:MAG: hypothetical protein ACE5K1_02965 [Acidiferrobacterales bacterium]